MLLVKAIVVIAEPEQMVCEEGVACASGPGLTKTVAVVVGPVQPLAVGVIVKVTVIGAKVVFVRAPDILPEPDAVIPVTVAALSLVQAYVVPVVLLVRAIVVIVAPEQMVWEAGVAIALGVGLTKTVAVVVGPAQPFAVVVIVKVTVIGAKVVFVKLPDILPVPLAVIPVTVAALSLVHAYVVPVVLLVNKIVVIVAPEQIIWLDGVASAFGVGLTSTVAVIGVPAQPFADGVIVKVTVTGAKVVLVKVPEILPVPLAVIPVTVAALSRVHAYVVPVVLLDRTIVLIATAEQTV